MFKQRIYPFCNAVVAAASVGRGGEALLTFLVRHLFPCVQHLWL